MAHSIGGQAGRGGAAQRAEWAVVAGHRLQEAGVRIRFHQDVVGQAAATGQRPHVGDEKIALNRALAAQRFLIGQGVSPAIISVNYVSAGDYVADNFSAVGRSLNRRVDIEVFNQ